eukprot:TRINITY_DN5583_c0_g1_i2.p1 TRINITY_DN5583_c0_g1~~TRINITY_DN5583_c0_g1_i2.p1  ORF type:complete len:283 (-),score=74.11 TRINITY_DN5583_c0_g1_i2:71-820(-)
MRVLDAGGAASPSLRVKEFKKKQFRDQNTRREEALARQKEMRRNLTNVVRHMVTQSSSAPEAQTSDTATDIAVDDDAPTAAAPAVAVSPAPAPATPEAGDAHMQEQPRRRKRAKQSPPGTDSEAFHRDQLMLPEPLHDVPADLAAGWYAVPVPAGTRCLVVSSRHSTAAIRRTGYVISRFQSALPNGSKASSQAGKAQQSYCILDCIFHQQSLTYYVLDVMCWKSYLMYDCDTDFRYASKFSFSFCQNQ